MPSFACFRWLFWRTPRTLKLLNQVRPRPRQCSYTILFQKVNGDTGSVSISVVVLILDVLGNRKTTVTLATIINSVLRSYVKPSQTMILPPRRVARRRPGSLCFNIIMSLVARNPDFFCLQTTKAQTSLRSLISALVIRYI